MSESRKAGAMIVENLGMFEEANRLLEKLQEEVFKNVDEIVKKWAKDNEWNGEYEFLVSDTWVAHPEWFLEEESEHMASLVLHTRQNNCKCQWITHLCGECQADFGFFFRVEHPFFGGKKNWNEFCKMFPEKEEIYKLQSLKEAGFIYEGKGEWFLPIKIDRQKLASDYENEEYIDSMEPVHEALENIKNVYSVFTELINEGKKCCP